MKQRALIILALATLLVAVAGPALAQNRLALEVGPLLPTGDMSDTVGPSLWLGARFELQDVNPLGQLATLSVIGRGGFAVLQPDSDFEDFLDAQGEDSSASYFDLGIGARAYSVASPFFVSASASYGHFEPALGDGVNGFTPSIGLGFSLGFAAAVIDVEARGHLAFVQDSDNLQFFTITGGAGFPF